MKSVYNRKKLRMSVTDGQRMENSILDKKFVNVHLLFRHANVVFKTRVGRISVQINKKLEIKRHVLA